MKINKNYVKEALHLAKNRKSIGAMLKDVWKGHYKMKPYTYIIAILTILYTLWPVDILPDFIPVIGLVDDGILLLILFQQLKKELVRYNSLQSSKVIVLK